jgi:taurine dioxygenase
VADIERETRVSATAIAAVGLSVAPCGPVLGAEVAGLRIDGAIAADVLRAPLLRRKILFFCNFDRDHDQRLALARIGGDLEGHPVIKYVPGYPESLDIQGSEGRVEDSAGNVRFRGARLAV